MDFNLKEYKRSRIKHYLKKVNFFFFFLGTSLNNESWIKIEQAFVNHKLRYFRILNKLMIKTLKNSIFKNLVVLIHGPIILVNTTNKKLPFKELENINPFISLLGFRLNNKIYSRRQIKNLKKISYIENISIFHNSIKTFTKLPYWKFKNKKMCIVSK